MDPLKSTSGKPQCGTPREKEKRVGGGNSEARIFPLKESAARATVDHLQMAAIFGTPEEFRIRIVDHLRPYLQKHDSDTVDTECLLAKHSSSDLKLAGVVDILDNPSRLSSLALSSICRFLRIPLYKVVSACLISHPNDSAVDFHSLLGEEGKDYLLDAHERLSEPLLISALDHLDMELESSRTTS